MRPHTVVSRGQTGLDRAALDWAIDHAVHRGGWCPRNRMAADGPLSAQYQLEETESAGYSQRTRLNVAAGDATLIISRRVLVGGSKLTKRFADELKKPVYTIALDLEWSVQIAALRRWLRELNIQTLNVAGPSESRCSGIYHQAYEFLKGIFTDG